MAKVTDVYTSKMKVITELSRVQEIDLKWVHFDYYVGDVGKDVFGNVFELFAETSTIPSVVYEVRLFFLRITINPIIINQFFPKKETFIIWVMPDEVRK